MPGIVIGKVFLLHRFIFFCKANFNLVKNGLKLIGAAGLKPDLF